MRSVPTTLILAGLATLAITAGTAQASVYYHAHRVSATLVGQIDASPCSDPGGCLRAVVQLKYRRHTSIHVVRCSHPKHLHVVGTYPFAGRRWVNVYACSKNYQWKLP